jgi:hypothetical protein
MPVEMKEVLNNLKLYFRILRQLHTPFVLFLDAKYQILSERSLGCLFNLVNDDLLYVAEYYDCDDFAWNFKALASQRYENGVGFVIGWYRKGLHAWNCAIMADGIYQIEPQTKSVFRDGKGYRPLMVII